MLQITVVMHAYINEDGQIFIGKAIICYVCLCQFRIRNEYCVIVDHFELCASPVNINDIALFTARVQFDVVADADDAVCNNMEAGEEIRERILKGECDSQAADT